MDENIERDRLGVQQDILQIHEVLGDRHSDDSSSDSEESDDSDVENVTDDGSYKLGPASHTRHDSEGSQLDRSVEDISSQLDSHLEATPENLLQLNLSYQDMIWTLLGHVGKARRKNHEIQASLSKKSTTRIKGSRPMTHFQKHYFVAEAGKGPPPSDEATQIRSLGIPNPFTMPAKSWLKSEDRALLEGVRNDGLQRRMQPLMAKQEILCEKRKHAIDDDETHKLTKEINALVGQLEDISKNTSDKELLGDRHRNIDWLKISSLHLNGERSETECQLRWQNRLHPSIGNQKWTTEEEAQLVHLAEKNQQRNWQVVANQLGTNRTPFECLSYYQEKYMHLHTRRPFSDEEDALMPELVKRFKIGTYIPFNKVAYFMEQRLPRQVGIRWQVKLDPEMKSGSWTKEEDKLLLAGVERYGRKWAQISRMMTGRTPAQIRDRYMYTLKPNWQRGRYCKKEDLIVLESVRKYGLGNWVEVSKEMHDVQCPRTPNSVLHHFNILVVKFFREVKKKRYQDHSAVFENLSVKAVNDILDEMIEERKLRGENDAVLGPPGRYLKKRYGKVTKQKRKPPAKPSPTTRKTRQESLDKKLVEAIKTMGSTKPTPVTRTKQKLATQRQQSNITFNVLLKALQVDTKSRQKFFASMTHTDKQQQTAEKSLENGPESEDEEDHLYAAPKSPTVSTSDTPVDGVCSEDLIEPNSTSITDNVAAASGFSGPPAVAAHVTIPIQEPSAKAKFPKTSRIKTTSSETSTLPTTPPTAVSPSSDGTSAVSVPVSEPSSSTTAPGNAPVPLVLHPATMPSVLPPVVQLPQPLNPNSQEADSKRSVFGKGAIRVPGRGYLVPFQNYLSQFKGCTPAVKTERPAQPPAQHLQTSTNSGLGTINIPGKGMLVPLSSLFAQSTPQPRQPVSSQQPAPVTKPYPVAVFPAGGNVQRHPLPAVNEGTPPTAGGEQRSSMILGETPTAPQANGELGSKPQAAVNSKAIIKIPGKGYLIPVKLLSRNTKSTLQPKKEIETNENSGLTTVIPGTPYGSLRSSQANPQTVRSEEGQPGNQTPGGNSSSPAKQVVHVTVVNDSEKMSYHVHDDRAKTSKNAKKLTSNRTEAAPPVETNTCLSNGNLPPAPQLASTPPSICTQEPLPPSNEGNSGVSKTKGVDKSGVQKQESVKKRINLPPLPPNTATVSGFTKLLLQRKQLLETAQRSKSFEASMRRRNNKDCTEVQHQKRSRRSEESKQKVTPSEQSEGQKENSCDSKAAYWTFERDCEKNAKTLHKIRNSAWYCAIRERFLSVFLWPALLSTVNPHSRSVLKSGEEVTFDQRETPKRRLRSRKRPSEDSTVSERGPSQSKRKGAVRRSNHTKKEAVKESENHAENEPGSDSHHEESVSRPDNCKRVTRATRSRDASVAGSCDITQGDKSNFDEGNTNHGANRNGSSKKRQLNGDRGCENPRKKVKVIKLAERKAT